MVYPLPAAQECLSGESGKVGGPLRGDVPRFDEEVQPGDCQRLEGEGDRPP